MSPDPTGGIGTAACYPSCPPVTSTFPLPHIPSPEVAIVVFVLALAVLIAAMVWLDRRHA